MITSLLVFAVGAQVLQTPFLPVGSRSEFQQTVYGVQTALSNGDSATASKLGKLLPKGKFTIGWDESSIPQDLREQFDQSRDLAIGAWKHIKGLDISVAPSGDLNIKFSKNSPKDAAGLPMESQLEFGENPRLTAVISLVRGNPSQTIIGTDAYMEIGHAIGAYLGISDDVLPGTCMYRDNRPGLRVFGPSRGDYYTASNNLKVSLDLLQNIQKNQKPASVEIPAMEVAAPKTQVGPIQQGLKVPLDFKVKNTGKGLLSFRLVPDCGCFTFPPPAQAQPGQEVTVRTVMDTTQYVGNVEKLLVLYSNDPSNPVKSFPVTFKSMPACRLYRPAGDTVLLPASNDAFDVLLTLPEGSKIMPQQYEWNGVEAKPTMEKWTGVAADPDLDEPPKTRHGYIFHIKLGKNQISGRSSGTLSVATNDDQFPQLTYTVFMQKGILALPQELFIGEVSSVARASFEVSRPGKAFKILGVDVGSKSLKAVVYPISSTDYRIDVIFNAANAPKGDFSSYIKVRVDDPQSSVTATIRGSVL